MSSASNGMKPCVSLVEDTNVVDDVAVVLDDHLENIKNGAACREESWLPFDWLRPH
jgi:hypothetical protein